MAQFVDRFSSSELSVQACLQILRAQFLSLSHSEKLILIGCGYQDGCFHVHSCNLIYEKIVDHLEKSRTCIAFSGEQELAKGIIDAVPIDRSWYTIPDASAFIQHVILTVSNIQRFGQTPITVSPDCDLLYIGAGGSRWLIPPLFVP